MEVELDKVKDIVEENIGKKEDKSPLVPILQDIQTTYGWLPEDAMVKASELMDVSLADLTGVATFYNEFRLKPLGDYHIVVCMGTACHVRGAPLLLSELERNLGIEVGEVTPDKKFSLETVRCVGTCAVAPVILVNGEFHGNMTKNKISDLVERLREEENDG